MSRHLPRRIVVSVLVSVAIAVALIITGLNLVRPTIHSASMANAVAATDMEACAAAPATWGWRSGGLSFFAYDRAGVSANPQAPPLEPELLRRALAGERAVDEGDPNHVIALVPRAEAGPCALVRVSSAGTAGVVRPRFMGVLLASTVGGMLLAALGTLFFVVWPLLARIKALAVAARGVGETGFEPRAGEPGPLGQIADILARSHRRVVETREALEARNRALEDHLAGIAHDLRTPLSSMQLALEVLAAESQGDLRMEARRALADGVYLAALVENLHQATRLRHAVDVTSGAVDLTEVVHRLERRFAIIGRHADVAVAAHAPDHPVPVACTPALAERAIANVIQNAIEHNPGQGHVAVILVVEGGRFCLTVADDGPGLPAGTLATMESETFLADSARARGPGLGMLITGEVARRAGWSLAYAARHPGLEVRLEGPLSA